MTEDQKNELQAELNTLVRAYGVTHAAFCGQTIDGEFLGMFVKVKMQRDEHFLSVLNIGRLWQFARETIRNNLNAFDKW